MVLDPNRILGYMKEYRATGYRVVPDGDRDVDLIVVEVTETPTISWDEDPGRFNFTHGLNITGGITLSGRLLVDDESDATTALDGSIQTDGGLGVVKKAHFGNRVTIENTVPQLRFIDTNASLDEGDWEFVALAGASFNLRTLTEAGSAGDTAFSVTRTGTTINTVLFPKGITLSDQLLADLGTEAAPGIAFDGFADDGMWHPADNVLAWSVGGSEGMRLTAIGLGIGATVFTDPLHVEGSARLKRSINASLFLESDNNTTGPFTVRSNSNVFHIANQLGGFGVGGAFLRYTEGGSLQLMGKVYIDASPNVGIGVIPTLKLDVNAKAGISPIGGFCVKLTNKTGSATVQGQLIETSQGAGSVNDGFETAVANSDEVFGIVLEGGVADGSEAWVVTSGIADVLIDGGGSIRGNRLIASASAGSADVWDVGGAVATHFQEIGHSIETRAGAGLSRAIVHFN